MPGLSWGCKERQRPSPSLHPNHHLGPQDGQVRWTARQQWCILAQDSGFALWPQSSQWSLNCWKHLEKLALNRHFQHTASGAVGSCRFPWLGLIHSVTLLSGRACVPSHFLSCLDSL